MIVCPTCQHKEMEGELFCGACGARLWGLHRTEARPTMTFDTRKLRDISDVVLPRAEAPALNLRAGQLALGFAGAAQPLLLEGRAEYTLGRESETDAPDVALNAYGARDKGVSRKHASLRVDRRQVLLTDLGSANGTWLNGSMLSAHEPVRLENGDEVRLGKLLFKIHFSL